MLLENTQKIYVFKLFWHCEDFRISHIYKKLQRTVCTSQIWTGVFYTVDYLIPFKKKRTKSIGKIIKLLLEYIKNNSAKPMLVSFL